MDAYTKPNEKKIGISRPKISHTGAAKDTRTRSERKAEKEAVAAERRAIKKAARQALKRKLLDELNQDG
jgi:hypothetical protein